MVSCILLYMGLGVGGLDRSTKMFSPKNERILLSEFEERTIWFTRLFDGFHASFQGRFKNILLWFRFWMDKYHPLDIP